MSAKLNKIAADHALLCRALIAKVARWELFDGNDRQGEVCVGGMRYFTELDADWQVPVLTEMIRSALRKTLDGAL